jgi:hypothetical protein
MFTEPVSAEFSFPATFAEAELVSRRAHDKRWYVISRA